jgi:hypothetical protein
MIQFPESRACARGRVCGGACVRERERERENKICHMMMRLALMGQRDLSGA